MSRLVGAQDLIKALTRFGDNAIQMVKDEIEGAAFEIEADAKINASSIPGAPPEIKQMISHQILDNGLTAIITQNAVPMGAYIEFGTGSFVKVAPEWKDLAWQFYVNGKGTLHAHPYMYPAFIKGRQNFLNALKRKLDILTNTL